MAKKKAPANTFTKVLQSVPSEAKFIIPMVADSQDEIYVDIDTNIQTGEAWLVYGAEWKLESIDPTVPGCGGANLLGAFTLQIHRNDNSLLLLNGNDDDLMFDDTVGSLHDVTSGGTNTVHMTWPRRFGRRTVTLSPTLRAIFRTYPDWASWSVATLQIAGKILYDRISAPDIGQSKIGQIANL